MKSIWNKPMPSFPGFPGNSFTTYGYQRINLYIYRGYDEFMPPELHRWDITPEEAIQIQKDLRDRIVLKWDKRDVSMIGGVDISIKPEVARAAIVVIRYSDLTPLEAVVADTPLVFPYIPGLLSFREGPAVLAAWAKLHVKPELLMFDGQGIAHPRGIGIASQMGLWLNRPTIGVAKSKLYGRHEEVGPARGDKAELVDRKGNLIGHVLRTKEKTKPLYISPGHLIDVEHSTKFVLSCSAGYRLPEPTRWAHKVAGGEKFPVQNDDPQLRLL
jgi:deoxyribonuclease V